MTAFIDITSTDAWLETARLIGLVSFGYIAILWMAMALWVYRDISQRTDDVLTRAVSVAVVALFFAPGLLVYFALRPRDTMDDAMTRRLETEAFASEIGDSLHCPQCRRAASDEFVVCPYCRASLRTPCDDCGRLLAGEWSACPYCEAPRGVRQPGLPQRMPAPPSLAPAPAPMLAPAPRAPAIQLNR